MSNPVALISQASTEELELYSQRLEDLTEKFVFAMDVSERSRRAYRANIKQFFSWMLRNRIVNPDRDTILAYKRHMQEQDLSTFTVSAYLTAVRLFFEWREGMKLGLNIAKGVKGAKKPHGHQKDALTMEQANSLLASIDRSTLQGKRDFAIINLLARTGLRTIEVVRANVEDIRNAGGKVVLYVQGKGRESRDEPIVLTASTEKPIRDYLAARGSLNPKTPLFGSLSYRNMDCRLTTASISRLVKAALRGIGIDSSRITAHSLRHTAISMVLEGGGSILQAQTLGRHANISTTMVYLHRKNRLLDTPEEIIEKLFDADKKSE